MHHEARCTTPAQERRQRIAAPFLAMALLLVSGLSATTAAAQPTMSVPQLWTGRMVVPEGVQPGLTADQFELEIFQLTTDQEATGLLEALGTGGQPALRDAMFRQTSKGWIRIGKPAAAEVPVIRIIDLPDGHRRVRLYSERLLRLYDKNDPQGSLAHPFGYLELVADPSGTGSGILIAAASLKLADEGLMLDSAGTPVIRIIDVSTDRPPAPPAKP